MSWIYKLSNEWLVNTRICIDNNNNTICKVFYMVLSPREKNLLPFFVWLIVNYFSNATEIAQRATHNCDRPRTMTSETADPVAGSWVPDGGSLSTRRQIPEYQTPDHWVPGGRSLSTRRQIPEYQTADPWAPDGRSLRTYWMHRRTLHSINMRLKSCRHAGSTAHHHGEQRCRWGHLGIDL